MKSKPVVPCVLFLWPVFVVSCGDAGPLSSGEMDVLKTFAVTDVPLDESNRVSDSVPAQALGKKFYFDRGVSGSLGAYNDGATNGSLGSLGQTNRIACADCHDLGNGGSDHRSMPGATSLGAGYSARNAPTVFNAAFSPTWQFWDGRRDSLWSQALGPIESPNEMNGSRLRVAHLLQDEYAAEYNAIFNSTPLADFSDLTRFPSDGKPGDAAFERLSPHDQMEVNTAFANFGKAVAAYERRLTSRAFEPSAFDKFIAGVPTDFSAGAIRGARLFVGKAGCQECHRGPMLTDFGFHNIGVPQQGDHVPGEDEGRYRGLGEVQKDAFNRRSPFSDSPPTDSEASALDASGPDMDDRGRFKTPTLRNVAKTAPYMHNGTYKNLWDVVNHYNFGGATGGYAGERELAPLLLTQTDLADLVEFLESLSDGPPLDPADVMSP